MAPFAPDPATPLPEDDFQPNAFPLEPGLRLLEASAGTGKTFALAHLSLRLLTEKAIPLRRLLVVTFTDAAAAELRERIGRRLQQALSGLQDPGWEPPDAVLADWLAEQRRSSRAGDTVMRLLLALEDLDGADITTIHGFCQRSLQRHALEAQRPPGLTLDSEGETLLEQVVHSYWQGQVLALPPHLIRGLSRQGMKTKALRSLLRTLDSDPGLELDALPEELTVDIPLDAALPALWHQRWERFRGEWQRRGPALMEALFAQAGEWKAAGAAYKPYTLKESKNCKSAVVDGFIALHGNQGEPPPYDAVLGQEMIKTVLHPGTFCKLARGAEGIGSRPIQLPERPLMEAVAALVDGPAELALLHACHWGRRELARRRQSLGLCSYAELLSGLDPGAEATAPTPLLAAVAGRYSAALIDEFQDTDPIQWRILRLAFGGGEHLLVMVGDPKQAIYRFRGGDLATYLAARAAAQRCYQMRDNRRSTPELIEALNAFLDRGLPRSNLAMPRLEAKADRGGDGQIPMELLWLGGSSSTLPSSSDVDLLLPAQMAAYVARLLASPPRLLESTGERALEPDDICFLVGTHNQAEDLRQALQDCGIASRLVSQADVFSTPAATALQRLLDALADPADANRLRLLAASPLMGWNADTLQEAAPLQWSDLASKLQRMAQVWPQQGLLGSLGALLTAEQMASHAKGGRFLADLQQVAELVQQRVHRERLGPHATARWLRRRRQAELERVPEAEQTHSDKVRQAVSVVTVHRSKGLEYPLVICPYLWLDGGKPQGEGRRWQPGPNQAPRLDLHRNRSWGDGYRAERDHQVAQDAERERLAYVALTRAMHRLVVAWVPAKDRECNPLYPWLFVNEPVPDVEDRWPDNTPVEAWRQRLEEQIAERRLPLQLLDPPALDQAGMPSSPRPEGAVPLATGPVPTGSLYRGWARSSYTSWTHHRTRDEAPRLPAEAVEEGRDTSDPGPEEETVLPSQPPPPEAIAWPALGPWAAIPRGSGFGECLHRVLEQIDYGSPPPSTALEVVVTHELRRAGLDERWAPPLLEAIPEMLSTPFGGDLGGLRPADLATEARMNELHFDLSLHHVRAADLARAFRDHPGGAFGEAYAAALSQLPVDHCGFLTGSIDLLFPDPATERWWVLDWKSNWLGRRDGQGRTLSCGPGDYGTDALRALMASHHYPLQAHLYLVALHRYLAWRLPAYDPEQHLGGYAYVFVRGTPGASGQKVLPGPVPGMVVERPPLGRLLALDRALGTAPSGWEPGLHP